MAIQADFTKLEVYNSIIGEWLPVEFKSFQFNFLNTSEYSLNNDAYFMDAKYTNSEYGTIVTVTATMDMWVKFITDHPEFLPYLLSIESTE